MQDRVETVPLDNPDEREVIIVVSNVDRERLEYPESGKDFKRGGICFVRDDIEFYDERSQAFLSDLKKKGLLRVGSTLLQSKYNPSLYIKADEVRSGVLERKYRHYAQVCNYLGAELISIKLTEETKSETKTNAQVKIRNPFAPVKVESSFSKELRDYYESIKEKKLGGNLPNIEEAENYVKLNSLQEDEDIQELINDRKTALEQYVKFPNELLEITYTVDLFKQVRKSLDLAATIEVPQYLVQVGAVLNRYVKSIERSTIDIIVKFPRKLEK